MKYTFQPLSQQQAEDIAEWQYDGDYAFYDMTADLEDLQQFLNPDERKDAYYAVFTSGELIGFYCFHKVSENTVDIGLGMKPDYTGAGKGAEFVQAGLDFATGRYKPEKMTLAVAAFNKRALRVYQKTGFQITEKFKQQTNGGKHDFVKMQLTCT